MTGLRFFAHLLSFLASVLYVQAVTITPTTVNETDGAVTITVTPESPTGAWFLTYETSEGSGTIFSGGNFFTIQINDDSVYQGDRVYEVNFTNGEKLEDPLPQRTTITIIDDELPPVQLEQPENVTVKENVGELNITLFRLPTINRTFDIGYYHMGTADETDDFELVTMSPITFAENQNEAVLTIMIVDDKIEEELEWICIYINSTEIEEAIMFYINIKDNDTPKSFHCLRASQDCKNGTCDISDFSCGCNTGFEGADCSIPSDDVRMDCESCVNGTCLKNGKCICDPGFAGEACDRSAYYHECTSTSFAICLTPFGIENFIGQMFVEGQEAESDCQLTPAPEAKDGIPDWCMGYAAVIDFKGTCGDLETEGGTDPATYEVNINIRYTANITKSSDEKVYLTCKSGEAILEFGPRTVDGEDQHFKQVAESEFAPATLQLTKPNGDDLPDTLTSPAVVRACVSVNEVPAYDFVTIDYIMADNGRGGDDFRSSVLYNEGCFVTSGVIFSGPEYDPDDADHTMCFSFEAFIFSHDSQLAEPQLVLTVNFTVGNDPDTPKAHTCTKTGRRKRQAERNEEETLQARLNIINPDYETSERLGNAGDSTCARWLYPAFIGVGVVALSMMVIIIILTVAVCKRFNERKARKDVYQ